MGKRRGNNEGSIFKRSDRRSKPWCAEITVEGKRLYHYGSTRGECNTWLKETIRQTEIGISYKAMTTTLSDYLDTWLSSLDFTIRPKTLSQYKQVVNHHIKPALGQFQLGDLRPHQIQSFYAQKIDSGTSQSTARIIHSVLRRALHMAQRWGFIYRNPADLVDKPKPVRREMKVLDVNQAYCFLGASIGSRFHALYFLAITTGLRQGELLGLQWSDVDWSSKSIFIQRQLQRIQGEGLIFSEPKSMAGKRRVVMGAETTSKLIEHRKTQNKEKLFAGERWVDNNLIFATSIGTPMDARNLVRDYKKILQAAGIPEIRFHDLRHTAATLMLREGVNPKVVQERLGHSTVSLTLDTYSHVLQGLQENAADLMDALFTPISIAVGIEPAND